MDSLTADIMYLTHEVGIYRRARYLGWMAIYIQRMREMDKVARPSLLARVRGLPDLKTQFDASLHGHIDTIEEEAAKAESLAKQAAEGHISYYKGLSAEFEESFHAATEMANSVPLGGGSATNGSNGGERQTITTTEVGKVEDVVQPPPLPGSSPASVSNGVAAGRPAYGGSRT